MPEVDFLDDAVSTCAILPHVIAIDDVNDSLFSGPDIFMGIRTGLVGQHNPAAGPQIFISVGKCQLVVGSEIVRYGQTVAIDVRIHLGTGIGSNLKCGVAIVTESGIEITVSDQ